jgi:hypothetical protein
MRDPKLHLPSAGQSWITLSSDYVPADGSTPVTAIIELRTADGQHRGDMFDAARVAPVLLVNGVPFDSPPQIIRRGPGVWFFTWTPPPGLGGSRATFGAMFDGEPIVSPRTVPLARDRWTAAYPSEAAGSSCATSPSRAAGAGGSAALLFGAATLAASRRRRIIRQRA